MIGLLPFDPTTQAQVILGVEIVLALSLIVGALLVRRGHVRWHAWQQSVVVLVNIPIVAVGMFPQFVDFVWPSLPGELGQPFYLFPTLMLIAGVTVEALGVYVILVAGTNWLPESLRFRNYKLWMRTVLALWWVVFLAGVATYYYWFLATGAS
jgi:hypothetical protein